MTTETTETRTETVPPTRKNHNATVNHMVSRVCYHDWVDLSDHLGAVVRKTWLAALILAPVLPAQVPVKPHLDTEGKAILAIQSGIAVADYWSTKRGLRYGGREANPLLATRNGQLSLPRYLALNGAQIGGTYAYERYLKHRLPAWARNTMRGVIYGGTVYWRGYVVGRNLIRANGLINSQR